GWRLGAGAGGGDPAVGPEPGVRSVLPGGERVRPAHRRHGPRPVHRAPAGRGNVRAAVAGLEARRGVDLLLQHAPGRRRQPGGLREREPFGSPDRQPETRLRLILAPPDPGLGPTHRSGTLAPDGTPAVRAVGSW